jgi:hypothetical protein
MSTESSSCGFPAPRLGELLLESQLLQQGQLKEALDKRKQGTAPLGAVLTDLGYVRARDVKSALFAQTLISEGAVAHRTAVAALTRSSRTGISVSEALEALESHNGNVSTTNQINQRDSNSLTVRLNPSSRSDLLYLVLNARLVNSQIYQEVQKRITEQGESLSQALLKLKAISYSDLKSLLDTYLLIQNGFLTKEEGAKALFEMRRRHCPLSQVLSILKLPGRACAEKLKLGELLLEAGLVPERECLLYIEASLTNGKLLLELLLSKNLINFKEKNAALTILQLSNRGVMQKSEAIELLGNLRKTDEPLDAQMRNAIFIKDEPGCTVPTLNLLVKAGIIENNDAARATIKYAHMGLGTLKALLADGTLQAITMQNAIKLAQLATENKLSNEEAANCLILCDREQINTEKAIALLGLEKEHCPEIDEPPTFLADKIKIFFQRSEFKFISLALFTMAAGSLICLSPLSLEMQLILLGSLALAVLVGIPFMTKQLVEKQRIQDKEEHEALLHSARETKNKLKSLRSCRVSLEVE